MRHTLAVLVENHPGVLARVAGLFSRRGYNINSVAVGETEDPTVARMTIVVEADQVTLEQITKQLHKLIDVIKISDITLDDSVGRELALIRVKADGASRAQIIQIVEIFRASIVDVNDKSLIIEITGAEDKVEAMLQLLRPYGVMEIVRTGKVAMVRGVKAQAGYPGAGQAQAG